MTYQWLLFDVDDTLFDYARSSGQALKNTFEDFNQSFQPGYGEVYERVNGTVWKEFEAGKVTALRLREKRFELLFAELKLPLDPALFSRCYLENLALGSYLIEGAEALIVGLAGKYRMAVITNGLKEVQRPRLKRASIGKYFEEIFISDEMGVAKPDRRFFDKVFEQTGHPAIREVLVIGDSLSSDIQGGLTYGLDTCWYNPRHLARDPRYSPRFEIDSLTKLPGLLSEN